jgi:hypothetical protein
MPVVVAADEPRGGGQQQSTQSAEQDFVSGPADSNQELLESLVG